MALTERSRAALFRGLSDVLDDEEAVVEVLSYFPTRDLDEPASRDFVDARFTAVDARLDVVEARMDARFAAVDARFESLEHRMKAGFESMDARFEALGTRMEAGFQAADARMAAGLAEDREANRAAMHAEIRSLTRWAVGTIVALFGLLIALGLIG